VSVNPPNQRVLAASIVASLAVLTSLGAGSGPPEVAISDALALEGGEIIRVRGIVVNAWLSDTGTLSLVLADLHQRTSLKVMCSGGISADPADVRIGDELRMAGEKPALWSSFDDVEILARSRDALSVESLSTSWELLIGDRFEITGILVVTDGGGYRLVNPEGTASIALVLPQPGPSRYECGKVLVDAMLMLDPAGMELVLKVYGMKSSS
jgi:hypothetical protein